MEKAAFTIYMLVLALSPLMFGAVHTYAYTFMSLGVMAATLLLLLHNVGRSHRTGEWTFRLPRTGLYTLFLAILGYQFFQTIPLPESLLVLLSPEAQKVGQAAIPAAALAGGESAPGPWSALAPYHYPVRMSVIRFTVYGLFFFGLLEVLDSRRRIERAVVLLLLIGCFDALYGILQTYSGNPHIWWFRHGASRQAVAGTYINRNHFAGFMAMGLILASAYSGAVVRSRQRLQPPGGSLRSRISAYFSSANQLSKKVLVLFSGVVMGIGLIFSASRGGMIAAAGGLLCLSLLFVFKKGKRRKGALVLFLFAVTSSYALYMGAEYPIGRFEDLEPSIETRAGYASTTMNLVRDYPLFGTGAGSFLYAYPKYQSPERYQKRVVHAHNDWLQFLAETGRMGFSLMLAGIFWFVFLALRQYSRRKDPFAVSLGAALLSVMVVIGIHSAFDFNLHIPANFLIFTALLAVGFSALYLGAPRHKGAADASYIVLPLRWRGGMALGLLLALVVWAGTWSIRHFVAEAHCSSVPNSTLNLDMDPPTENIAAAIKWDQWNAVYHFRLALNALRPDLSATLPQTDIAPPVNMSSLFHGDTAHKIIPLLQRAIGLNPFDGRQHLLLGWAYASLWDNPDYHQKWLPAADLSMQRAAYFMQEKAPGDYGDLGDYWVMRSSTLHPADPAHPAAIEQAAAHYRRALNLSTEKARRRALQRIVDYVWIFYPDEALLKKFIELPLDVVFPIRPHARKAIF